MEAIDEDIIAHIASSKENILAAQKIYKSYAASIGSKVLCWTDRVLSQLQQDKSFASWINATKRDSAHAIADSYANACKFAPFESKEIIVCIQFQKAGAQNPVIGILLHNRLARRAKIVEAFRMDFSDISKNANENWLCYRYLPNPYKNWLENAELVEELCDMEYPMLYDNILECCDKVQKFIDKRSNEFPELVTGG